MQPIAGGRANESPGWASASSSWSVGNIRIRPPPRINRVQNQPTIAVAITGREFQRSPDSVVFHWVTRHGHGRNGAVANLTVDAVEVILEKAVLKGRTIRRKRMTAVPTHRSMAADAVFARVGGILVQWLDAACQIGSRADWAIKLPPKPSHGSWKLSCNTSPWQAWHVLELESGSASESCRRAGCRAAGSPPQRSAVARGSPDGDQYGWNQNQHVLSPTVQYVRDHPLDAPNSSPA